MRVAKDQLVSCSIDW